MGAVKIESYFTFLGKKSSDYHLRVLNDISFTKPKKDIWTETVGGLDGSVLFSNDRYEDVEQTIPCTLDLPKYKNIEQASTDLSNWLHSGKGWSNWTWSGDKEHVYQAVYFEEMDIQHVTHTFGRCLVKFKMKPFKYQKSGLAGMTLINNQIIWNTGTRPSKPLIDIIGDGDIKVYFGGVELALKNIDRRITIDCLHQTAIGPTYQPAYDKLVDYSFPTINTGKNIIRYTGNVKTLQVTPRWEVLV